MDEMSRIRLGLGAGGATDLQTRSQVGPGCCSPYLAHYIRTPLRFALGGRTVIVMSSKVAQKSYGTEKRCVMRSALVADHAEDSDLGLLDTF